MTRVSKGRVNFLKRIYKLNSILDNIKNGGGVDLFALASVYKRKAKRHKYIHPMRWRRIS